MHPGQLASALQQLGSTGRVLYVAAHPDDENTRLLSYLVGARHLRVAYLSLTRGGGGQNLIGPEQDDLLGVIRTQELLAARRLDGALQRFTRMKDFGYSKSADETLRLWQHDEALADVVFVIRSFQPDVIITRFTETPPNHGHHTASAVLAREAFAAAADPKRFPEQLAQGVGVWQAQRLLHNVTTFNNPKVPEGALALDVGAYDARLGLSYGELAARSRTQHKSQGFGVPGERGPLLEHFVSLAGQAPSKDLFEGMDLTWRRLGAAAEPFAKAIAEAQARLERDAPEKALPALLEAHRALEALPEVPRVRDARAQLLEVIAGAAGLFLRATAASPSAVPGASVPVSLEVVMRRPAGLRLERLLVPGLPPQALATPLELNGKKKLEAAVPIPADAAMSSHYWLAEPPAAAAETVRDPRLIGDPEGPPALRLSLELGAGSRRLTYELPVLHAFADRVHGERLRRFIVTPPVMVTPTRGAVMLPNGAPTAVALRVRAGRDGLEAEVSLPLPAGWKSEPASQPVTLARAGDETVVRFVVRPPKDAAPVVIAPQGLVGGVAYAYRQDIIDYPHLPMQVVVRPAELRLVPLALKLPKGIVGYVQGSGDTLPEDLVHLGVGVELLSDEALLTGELSRFAAIVLGIRAYNTREVLQSAQARLLRYVEGGGTLVVQYNVNSRLSQLDVPIGPLPLQIGRARVTDERAAMTLLDPKHPVFTRPNLIGAADFDGWVQERGLYFAETWDPKYTPLLAAADPGEEAQRGALLVAQHGKGRFVYTGLSFFRQLPAGVPGAYRLFVNLLGGA